MDEKVSFEGLVGVDRKIIELWFVSKGEPQMFVDYRIVEAAVLFE